MTKLQDFGFRNPIKNNQYVVMEVKLYLVRNTKNGYDMDRFFKREDAEKLCKELNDLKRWKGK